MVFVCTGNRGRSALAEALFRHYALGIVTAVCSVGTHGIAGAPPLPAVVATASQLGVDLSNHRAHALRAMTLERADLVLGFEPVHVSTAVVAGGARIDRTFLLGELVALLAGPAALLNEPNATARSLIAMADTRRIRTRPDATRSVPDPVGRSPEEVDRICVDVDLLVRELVMRLFGPT